MCVLKIATYSLNTRWFTAVAATLMMAFITQLYGFNAVVPYIFIASLVIFFAVAIFEIVRTVLFYRDTLNELLNPEKTLNFLLLLWLLI